MSVDKACHRIFASLSAAVLTVTLAGCSDSPLASGSLDAGEPVSNGSVTAPGHIGEYLLLTDENLKEHMPQCYTPLLAQDIRSEYAPDSKKTGTLTYNWTERIYYGSEEQIAAVSDCAYLPAVVPYAFLVNIESYIDVAEDVETVWLEKVGGVGDYEQSGENWCTTTGIEYCWRVVENTAFSVHWSATFVSESQTTADERRDIIERALEAVIDTHKATTYVG